jgi:uncharacterized protein YlbG (UPF0298 family)
MNIAVKKVEIIEWLTQLQDESLLKKVESLRIQSIKKKYEDSLKPMTGQALKSMLKRAEKDYAEGKHIIQENLEEESKNW